MSLPNQVDGGGSRRFVYHPLSISEYQSLGMADHLPSYAPSLRSRVVGCLAGLAVGNTLGLDVEGCTRAQARAIKGEKGPLAQLRIIDGDTRWDDDLAMAMALAQALVDLPGTCEGLDLPALEGRYMDWYRTNGRGVGSHTGAVLRRLAARETQASRCVWEEKMTQGQRPLGNGCVMRIAPLGLRFAATPERISELAAQDAALTHWDPICRQGAGVIALLTAALLRQEEDPLAFVHQHMGPLEPELAEAIRPLPLAELAVRGLDGNDMGSTLLAIQVAVSVLHAGHTLQDALPWVLRQGGDADTLGAIVGGLLGARDGLEAIPVFWRACVLREAKVLELGECLVALSGLIHSSTGGFRLAGQHRATAPSAYV